MRARIQFEVYTEDENVPLLAAIIDVVKSLGELQHANVVGRLVADDNEWQPLMLNAEREYTIRDEEGNLGQVMTLEHAASLAALPGGAVVMGRVVSEWTVTDSDDRIEIPLECGHRLSVESRGYALPEGRATVDRLIEHHLPLCKAGQATTPEAADAQHD